MSESNDKSIIVISGGSTGVCRHTVVCASKDASVSLHQAHRVIGLGGDQIRLGWCAASAGIQHRAAAEGALEDSL